MKTPAVLAVMNALGQGNAMFVGGCVRNTLLDVEVTDIDIATKHHPDKVIEILSEAGIKTVPTGIDHGTITAVIDKQPFEITTLRKDVATDGRRATVAFAETWEEDAQRRDFTMNTLLADTNGHIYDPTGQGIDDLKARKVVFVGEAEQRIQEDILRILRFFRFHAIYGEGAPEDKALKACAKFADKIPTLSKERITQEFLKIISVDNPVDTLRMMVDNKIPPLVSSFDLIEGSHNEQTDPSVKPKDDIFEVFDHLCTFQNRYGLAFVASRLFTLAGFKMDNIEAMETLLLLPKVFKKDIQAIDSVLNLPDLSNDHAVKVAIYKHGRVGAAQALMIELATDRVMNGYAPTAIDIVQNWDIPNFPITGDDLIKQGIPKGPGLGKELERLEEEWIENGFA